MSRRIIEEYQTASDKILYSDLIDELYHIEDDLIKDTANLPTLIFKDKIIDSGLVEYKGECEFTFKAKNIGDKPVIINSVKVSCKCMSIGWDKNPILPNGNAKIVVKYDTSKKGGFSKLLFVLLSSGEVIELIVKGKIY